MELEKIVREHAIACEAMQRELERLSGRVDGKEDGSTRSGKNTMQDIADDDIPKHEAPKLHNVIDTKVSKKKRNKIFTNGDKVHAAKLLSRLGLEDCFEGVICFGILNSHTTWETPISVIPKTPILWKPSKEAIKRALLLANADPKRTTGIYCANGSPTDEISNNAATARAILGTKSNIIVLIVKNIHNKPSPPECKRNNSNVFWASSLLIRKLRSQNKRFNGLQNMKLQHLETIVSLPPLPSRL
ncbi:uncharacterized protein LOC131874406 [Cryptomeria japonica]|uniref:uncharacterized protein LOC131874406 n=1 Tax=Cryptomeria japonica TaxID=3369 RepID=UPI0027D9F1D7|nr:uncharacterized protein LOC131874406 [Cryptomeria japonica]